MRNTLRKCLFGNIAAVMTAGTLSFVIPAKAQLYGINNTSLNFGSGPIYRINTSTGEATLAATIVGINDVALPGLESLNGTLYASNVHIGNTFHFGRVNLGTGVFTSLYEYQAASLQGLAVNPATGLFYSANIVAPNDISLITITTTGAVSTIASLSAPIVGMAYASTTNTLYAIDDNTLYTVNTTTGFLTTLGSHGQSFLSLGLAYDDATDTLYMNRGGTTDGALYTLNKTNGAPTLIGGNGTVEYQGIAGLAFVQARGTSAPEPGTCLLLAGGLLPLAVGRFVRRRR